MPADRTAASLQVEYDNGSTRDVYTVDEIEDFDYTSDMMAVGDESHFTIVNPRRKYTDKLKRGSLVKLYLSNPRVNNGAETLKFYGRIIDRMADSERGTIKLTCADLGWHLANCDAPLWFRLEKGRVEMIIDPDHYQIGRDGKKHHFIDPSWGIKGYRLDNAVNRDLKQGKASFKLSVGTVKARAEQDLNVFVVQVEPGEKVLDKIQEQGRRYNFLVNVSVDGYIQLWRPDYDRAPLYKIRCTDSESNVKSGQMHESARNIFTTVECVGEQLGFEADQEGTADNPNATKKRGAVYDAEALPYLHRQTFGDGEMFEKGLALKMARWRRDRELFDSWYVQYSFPDHHLSGTWWESDQLADVVDDDLGIRGPLYVQRVRCEGSVRGGDLSTVILRKPRLLQASYGVAPIPSLVRSSSAPTKVENVDKQTDRIVKA